VDPMLGAGTQAATVDLAQSDPPAGYRARWKPARPSPCPLACWGAEVTDGGSVSLHSEPVRALGGREPAGLYLQGTQLQV